MGPSFNDDEKRFVLAEIIKASQLDVEALASFVRSKQLNFDFMSMQLPQGRNMHQCVEAIDRMAIPVPYLKRKSRDEDLDERPAKRMDYADHAEHLHYSVEQSHIAPTLPGLILPPAGTYRGNTNGQASSPPRPAAPEPPKKRGRPSRADKAKRDLRPLLPQPPPAPPRPMSSSGQSPGPFRPIRPAFTPTLHAVTPRASTPPGAYAPVARQARTSPAVSPEGRVQVSPSNDSFRPTLCKTEGPASLPESSSLRVMVE